MAVVGIGIDLCECGRIAVSLERFGIRFVKRILTEEEQRLLPNNKKHQISYMAARFAAKEAAVKALGTGFANGISFLDLEVRRVTSGKPQLYFYGNAALQANALDVHHTHLTLTHSRLEAAAVVILER